MSRKQKSAQMNRNRIRSKGNKIANRHGEGKTKGSRF